MLKFLEELKKGWVHTFKRDDEVLGERKCTVQVDDPGLDGTGFEHPAYLRGKEHAWEDSIRVVNEILDAWEDSIRVVNEILDGTKSEKGKFGHKPLEELRQRLLKVKNEER